MKPARVSQPSPDRPAAGATRPLVAQGRIDTPLGPMTAAATSWGLAGLWFDGQRHHPGALDGPVRDDDPFIETARRELQAYFAATAAGASPPAFSVTLDPGGTPFQRAVWAALALIPSGRLDSYGAIARRLGRPEAARAVGAAVGRNPLSIVVPCHRVVGSGGALTGYAGGLDRKRALLGHEAAPGHASPPRAEQARSAPLRRAA